MQESRYSQVAPPLPVLTGNERYKEHTPLWFGLALLFMLGIATVLMYFFL